MMRHGGMASLPASVLRTREFLREEYSRAFRHDHWNVGIVDAPISTFLKPHPDVTVRWLPPPARGTYRADPFGVVRRDGTEIFFEEYRFRSGKGVISHLRADGGAGFAAPSVALDLPVHASYPFLLEHGGSVYCVPETSSGAEIAIYEATDFPDGWRKAAILVPGVAGVDPTIVEHGGKFWLLCTELGGGPFSQLRIWYASDLFGPWTPHPANPVKTDPRSARPGGTPFRVNGDLYRPAQDCSSTYGGGVTINRVVTLTEEAYREEPVATLRPFREGRYTRGIHTLSALGNRTLVDGKCLAFNRSEMGRNLRESVRERWPQVLERQRPHQGAIG